MMKPIVLEKDGFKAINYSANLYLRILSVAHHEVSNKSKVNLPQTSRLITFTQHISTDIFLSLNLNTFQV